MFTCALFGSLYIVDRAACAGQSRVAVGEGRARGPCEASQTTKTAPSRERRETSCSTSRDAARVDSSTGECASPGPGRHRLPQAPSCFTSPPARRTHPETRRNGGIDSARAEASRRIPCRTVHQGRAQLWALPPVTFSITRTHASLETGTSHTRKRRVCVCGVLASGALASLLENRCQRAADASCWAAKMLRTPCDGARTLPPSRSIKDGWGTAVFAILLPSSLLLSSFPLLTLALGDVRHSELLLSAPFPAPRPSRTRFRRSGRATRCTSPRYVIYARNCSLTFDSVI